MSSSSTSSTLPPYDRSNDAHRHWARSSFELWRLTDHLLHSLAWYDANDPCHPDFLHAVELHRQALLYHATLRPYDPYTTGCGYDEDELAGYQEPVSSKAFSTAVLVAAGTGCAHRQRELDTLEGRVFDAQLALKSLETRGADIIKISQARDLLDAQQRHLIQFLHFSDLGDTGSGTPEVHQQPAILHPSTVRPPEPSRTIASADSSTDGTQPAIISKLAASEASALDLLVDAHGISDHHTADDTSHSPCCSSTTIPSSMLSVGALSAPSASQVVAHPISTTSVPTSVLERNPPVPTLHPLQHKSPVSTDDISEDSSLCVQNHAFRDRTITSPIPENSFVAKAFERGLFHSSSSPQNDAGKDFASSLDASSSCTDTVALSDHTFVDEGRSSDDGQAIEGHHRYGLGTAADPAYDASSAPRSRMAEPPDDDEHAFLFTIDAEGSARNQISAGEESRSTSAWWRDLVPGDHVDVVGTSPLRAGLDGPTHDHSGPGDGVHRSRSPHILSPSSIDIALSRIQAAWQQARRLASLDRGHHRKRAVWATPRPEHTPTSLYSANIALERIRVALSVIRAPAIQTYPPPSLQLGPAAYPFYFLPTIFILLSAFFTSFPHPVPRHAHSPTTTALHAA
ncbi:hypothetical protein A4X13_0g7947 [Tilletia indica]|uniref:Uncharacterized protein n=1 Tax=Tilletia indica TaxID=43049 RepID=A0A177T5Q8_9BASI|nr:hypothetical protein A4X13_0g7947 [Tilletia indica]